MSDNKLKRSVYLDGVLLAEGTEVTAEQRKLLTNPRLFAEPVDATGPDANDAREYFQAVSKDADDSGLRKQANVADDTDDRAAAGAKLARGNKVSAPAATA
jgi:hypothetical protein